MKDKRILIGVAVLFVAIIGVVFALRARNKTPEVVEQPRQKLEQPVNQIPASDRPYVELIPLASRNRLSLVIHELRKPATSVEAVLEYDRNQGVLDAVLKEFPITNLPQTEQMFMGSQSAGGHITYHDDVIGGTYTLNFMDEDYALEEAWRYDDKETSYTQLSTADGKFQVELAAPYATPKVVVMKSPGLPENIDGQVIAGAYLFRGVSALPQVNATVSIRLDEAVESATMFGWNGDAWEEIETTIDGRVVSASTQVYQAYVVTQ